MALQELDIEIFYHHGRINSNADVLSRLPLPDVEAEGIPHGIVSAVTVAENADPSTDDLAIPFSPSSKQSLPIWRLVYYQKRKKFARSLALSRSQYLLEDGVLYHVEPDSTLRVIPSEKLREQLFKEAHRGCFGGHLGEVKVHSELQRTTGGLRCAKM